MDTLHALYRQNNYVLIGSIFISLIFFGISLWAENILVALLPIAALIGVWSILDFRNIYYVFALVIPFSIEIELPGGLGTDLPSEPIMWIITGLSPFLLIFYLKKLDGKIWTHPITILILLHLFWIGFTALLSSNTLISFKFFLAKTWYLIPFYFLFVYIFRDRSTLEKFLKVLIFSTTIAVIIVMFKHALTGFSFSEINRSAHPIFRNHVNYACMLVALFPFIVALAFNTKNKIFYYILPLFIIAIYFSYTRAAILTLAISFLAYYVIKWRLLLPAICASLIIITLSIPYLLHNNKYLDYAPEYERAIAHESFDNLIEATYKLEDISTMERLYRWVSGVEMIKEKPLFGFGPATFYSFYQNYSLSQFQTYVSNNPEKSGIHNYYLMTTVEQGFPGLFILLGLIITALLYGEKYFHLITDPKHKNLAVAATVSIINICSVILINDLIEADKIGPIFFISIAIIVVLGNGLKPSSSHSINSPSKGN